MAEVVVGRGEVTGWYQWVRESELDWYMANHWVLCAHMNRFHFDSYLMFRPESLGRPEPLGGECGE